MNSFGNQEEEEAARILDRYLKTRRKLKEAEFQLLNLKREKDSKEKDHPWLKTIEGTILFKRSSGQKRTQPEEEKKRDDKKEKGKTQPAQAQNVPKSKSLSVDSRFRNRPQSSDFYCFFMEGEFRENFRMFQD
jgi:hypothetical protein